jgi:hypothetical protein
MSVITEAHVNDGDVLASLLTNKNVKVTQVTGEGAYDRYDCYKATVAIGAKPCFPPRIHAARRKPIDEAMRLRNQAVDYMKNNGLKEWKKKHHYHRRNLSETAFSRLKKILGDSAASRTFENQVKKLQLCCHLLNRMNWIGMPESYRI